MPATYRVGNFDCQHALLEGSRFQWEYDNKISLCWRDSRNGLEKQSDNAPPEELSSSGSVRNMIQFI